MTTVVQMDARQSLMLIICRITLAMFDSGGSMTKQERDRDAKRAERARQVIEETFGGTEITQISMDDINRLSDEDLEALYSRLPKRGPWLTGGATSK